MKIKFAQDIIDKVRGKAPKEVLNTEEVKRFFKDDANGSLRLNYDLCENSIVFDVGGYKAEFAKEIFCKYQSFIHIFEPVPDFF
ncbi:hypothetical protein tpqmel_0492, partial [Candidatus Gastranaerophilus sp. (ex Termes propinquus)]